MVSFIYDAPAAVTEYRYGVPVGWYTDCDSAVCANCAPAGFMHGDYSEWGGFEGWENPAAICLDDESDSVTHCRRCSAVIGHDLTIDGTRELLSAITDFITDPGSHTADVMAQWWDAYSGTFDESDLLGVIEHAMAAAGCRVHEAASDRPYLNLPRAELDSRLGALVDRSLGGPMNFSDADREELHGLKAEQDRREGR